MPVLLIVGLVALLVGIILFFAWIGHFLVLIKAIAPLAFIAGGAVAAYLGWEEMKDKKAPPIVDFSNPDEANRYKAEAKAYQAEINEVRENGTGEVIETSAVETQSADDGASADSQENKS